MVTKETMMAAFGSVTVATKSLRAATDALSWSPVAIVMPPQTWPIGTVCSVICVTIPCHLLSVRCFLAHYLNLRSC